VSQNTVREALVQLQHVGLVQRLPNRASYVTKLSEEEIRERIMVRLPLEQLACAEALRRMTEGDLEDLENKVEIISRNIVANDYAGYCTADLEFHRATWRYARNRTLYKTLDQITAPLFAYLNILQRDHAVVLSERTQSHKLITDAFRSNDSHQLEQIIQQHCGSTYGLLLEFFTGSAMAAAR
jgi:DNA-binding GntR family transcriptional regulator